MTDSPAPREPEDVHDHFAEEDAVVPDLLTLPDDALYSARLPMALAYAAVMHSPQKRKDDLGTPHITHPMAVAGLVWHYGLGVELYEAEMEDLVISALLHEKTSSRMPAGTTGCARSARCSGRGWRRWSMRPPTAPAPTPLRRWNGGPAKEQRIARVRRLAQPAGDEPVDAGACLVIAADRCTT